VPAQPARGAWRIHDGPSAPVTTLLIRAALLAATVLVAAALAFGSPHVPAAIDRVVDGDTVVVRPGGAGDSARRVDRLP
jgi:endonuclease YncB( thermonuclease family)